MSFFGDGYFDKVLKVLIKNNLKLFRITWQTMDSFYNNWDFGHRELIEIDVATYNCISDSDLAKGKK